MIWGGGLPSPHFRLKRGYEAWLFSFAFPFYTCIVDPPTPYFGLEKKGSRHVSIKVSSSTMSRFAKPVSLLISAVVFVAGEGAAQAASSGSFAGGGVLQQGIDALQHQLVRHDAPSDALQFKILDRDATPVIGFTPRFAGVPIDLAEGASVDRGSVLKTRFSGVAGSQRYQSRAMTFEQSHDLGLVKLDLSAIAGFSGQGDQDLGQSATFGFGGGLKFDGLSGLRVGASYRRLDEELGLARDSITAGVGYDFGVLDTRLSVSNVAQYDSKGVPTDGKQVWVVGGQMQLTSRLVVGGDLAYSTGLDGTDATSGVVNFRFNF